MYTRSDGVKTDIYFIRAEEPGLVKVGKSSNVEGRLKGMAPGCPFALELVGVLRNVLSRQEFLIHRKFAHLRQRGEWFLDTAELRYYYLNPYILDDPEKVESVSLIARNIRKYRHEQFIEADELAEAVGLTRQTIYDYEGGRAKPSRKSIRKIAEFLKIKISDLTD